MRPIFKPATGRIWLALTAAVLMATLLTGCGGAAAPETPSPTPTAAPRAASVRDDRLTAEGRVVPLESASLAFATGGLVAEIPAAEGQAVRAGDPLVRLDDAAVAAAVAQAEAGLAAAESALAAARAGAEMAAAQQQTAAAGVRAAEAQRDLLAAGARPEELAAAERNLAAAEAGVATARAERDAAVDVSSARVSAAEAQLAAALAQLTALQDAYEAITTTCVTLPDGSEVCPGLGAPEESARAQMEAAQASYAAAQLALEDARAGSTVGQRRAADAAVAVAVARRDMAAAQLALAQAGARPETLELAGVGVAQAEAGSRRAALAVDEAAAAVARAEADVAAARSAVDAARAALAQMTLVAPFDGVVAELSVEVGELAAPGAPVARLGSAGRWAVETSDLVELDVVALAEGQTVEVTLDALPGRTLRGEVLSIGRVPEILRGDVVYRVRVALDDYPDLPLRWGMTAEVSAER